MSTTDIHAFLDAQAQQKDLEANRLQQLKEDLADRVNGAVFRLFRDALLAAGTPEHNRLLEKAGTVAIFGTLHVHNVLRQEDASQVRAYLKHVREMFGNELSEGARQGLNLAIGYAEEYLR